MVKAKATTKSNFQVDLADVQAQPTRIMQIISDSTGPIFIVYESLRGLPGDGAQAIADQQARARAAKVAKDKAAALAAQLAADELAAQASEGT